MCGLPHTMKESLVKIGLSETESNIYLALLKLGSSSVVSLSKETEFLRLLQYFPCARPYRTRPKAGFTTRHDVSDW